MKRPLKWTVALLVIAYLATGVYHALKPMPAGADFSGPLRPATDAAYLIDSTFLDAKGEPVQSQEIFDEVLRLVAQAERLVLMDMFLFNDFAAKPGHRSLTQQVTDAMIGAKTRQPKLQAILITDPLNTLYGGLEAPHLERLRGAGVQVVMTDLSHLRDSNPTWSALWRLCCQWLGNSTRGGWIPNMLGPGDITLRSYMALLNFKANHRKTLVVDEGNNWSGLVTSANPHDASSAHSNTALRFGGAAALDLLRTEAAVMQMSGHEVPFEIPELQGRETSDTQIQILTEASIRDAAVAAIDHTQFGDHIRLAQFYLSHRSLVESLVAAHHRGATVRVLLDPNKDAFGSEKSGIPNRQVAMELHQSGLPVRWCATQGEQCHSKTLLVTGRNRPAELILGSANYTRRNIDNFNLETNARLLAPGEADIVGAVRDQFERRWSNTAGEQHSHPYEVYADESVVRYWQYRLMEFTGWSTF